MGKERSSFFEFLKSQVEEHRAYFENMDFYLSVLRKKAKEFFGDDTRVFLFGSALEGKSIIGKSDIDVAVVSPKISMSAGWQAEMKFELYKSLGDTPFDSPFEIHLLTPELFETWFKKFVKKFSEVR